MTLLEIIFLLWAIIASIAFYHEFKWRRIYHREYLRLRRVGETLPWSIILIGLGTWKIFDWLKHRGR